jgi:hypothetical protein
MSSSTDITTNGAGYVNVDSTNVAAHLSIFRYANSGSGISGTDYIKLNVPMNVDIVGESQQVFVNVG